MNINIYSISCHNITILHRYPLNISLKETAIALLLTATYVYLQRQGAQCTKTQSSLPRYALLFFDTQTQTRATSMDAGIHIHHTCGITLH